VLEKIFFAQEKRRFFMEKTSSQWEASALFFTGTCVFVLNLLPQKLSTTSGFSVSRKISK